MSVLVHVTYRQLLDLRPTKEEIVAEYGGPQGEDTGAGSFVDLLCNKGNMVLQARVSYAEAAESDWQHFKAKTEPFVSKALWNEEFRFRSPNYVGNRRDWDGRSHGDLPKDIVLASHPAAQYDDVNFRWVDNLANSLINQPGLAPFATYAKCVGAVGKGIWKDGDNVEIVKYDSRQSLPSASKATNNVSATIASCIHGWAVEPVAGSYDLVVDTGTTSGYKWTYGGVTVDNVAWVEGNTVVLDAGAEGKLTVTMGAAAPGALPATDSVAVTIAANETYDHWIRLDRENTANRKVTTSRFRIRPYAGKKMAIGEAWFTADLGVGFPADKNVNYTVYANEKHPALVPLALPPGTYQVKQYVYDSVVSFREGANNGNAYQDYELPAGQTYKRMAFGYDYLKTKEQILDDRYGMYIDVTTDDDVVLIGGDYGKCTFIGMQYDAF